jgi:hypothetical protein
MPFHSLLHFIAFLQGVKNLASQELGIKNENEPGLKALWFMPISSTSRLMGRSVAIWWSLRPLPAGIW